MARRIYLFDVDGTLTPSRLKISDEMRDFLAELSKTETIGFVGGSDIAKQREQLGDDVMTLFEYKFAENGLQAWKGDEQIADTSLRRYFHIMKQDCGPFISECLRYIADTDTIPVKTGTFVEFRRGMINLCPIGRNCTQEEREAFVEYDRWNKVRERMVEYLRERFGHLDLRYSIGGQISIDVFPRGWDKTYCLKHLQEFDEIHFFGDKTAPGGNDHEIYEEPDVIGHAVTDPADTIRQVRAIWDSP